MEDVKKNRKVEVFETLKARMKQKQYTNYQLHKLTNISQSSLSRYFNNESDMSLSAFLKICNALDFKCYLVPADEITEEFESSLNLKIKP
ncbi:helix-turn-helix transcriptional regulator [Aquimarina sp. MMG016]|uniref:helix-turn-helix domain-containing protein n=1 Tax=Aquimarina sp. MMG016 TaxID=2822690 RepID=UPI001B3A179E|nr:helix-turn-helix transcriptional regulator [Aquimarina sp. MMG016]MBQ4818977.1 helix-turn-helix transcriptional regulator [Aquimarina sp. MMG016]